jgi:ABC-2 type transport system ATP-binding protein
VYDDLTVTQNLAYFARVIGAPRNDTDRVVDLVGLAGQAGRRVSDLSGGQRGRVSLAVALLGTPELIVLDEPTVGLDPVLRAELWRLFRSLADVGVTILVSSHVMDEALRCDRLLLMREGEIVADTTPSELLESTGTDDPESAFLQIIETTGRHEHGRGRHGRHAEGGTGEGEPR